MRFRAEARVAIVSRLYRLLSKVNEAIVRVRDQAALFQEICRIAVEEGRFKMAWVGMVDARSGAVQDVARYGVEKGYLERVHHRFPGRAGKSRPHRPRRLGRPVGHLQRHCQRSPHGPLAGSGLDRGAIDLPGLFPLRVDGRVVGSISVYRG